MSKTVPTHVILGNSAAGLSAARAIRERDTDCSITLVSAEPCVAYSPVLLTYFIKGRIGREGLFVVEPGFYDGLGVQTVFGDPAVSIDPSSQTIRLESGKRISYDNLLIATGADPIMLCDPRPSNVLGVRTIADADVIKERAKEAKDVVVIGGGLIGLQCADALYQPDRKPTLIEAKGQLLPESADSESADILLEQVESRGVKVLLNTMVSSIEQRQQKAAVVCESGEVVLGDIVLVGVGVRPNLSFLRGSGISTNRGILVDDRIRTNFENVYAAGDVSEGPEMISGSNAHIPTWTNAERQGRVAGLNMSGLHQAYEGGLRETVTSAFGISVSAVGLAKPLAGIDLEELTVSRPEMQFYRKLLLSDGRLVGVVQLKRSDHQGVAPVLRGTGIAAALIRKRKDVSDLKKQLLAGALDVRALLSDNESDLQML